MELRDSAINLQEEVRSAIDKLEEDKEKHRIWCEAMSIANESYISCMKIWIMTEPPRWRFKKHREWREKQPKRTEMMDFAMKIAEEQISLNKSLKNSE